MMLVESLETIKNELPNCLSVSVVELAQGIPLLSTEGLENGQGADAFHAQLYEMTREGLREMGAANEIQSIVIESRLMNFVSSPIGNTGYFIHLVVKRKTTLGFVHAILRKYKKILHENLEEYL